MPRKSARWRKSRSFSCARSGNENHDQIVDGVERLSNKIKAINFIVYSNGLWGKEKAPASRGKRIETVYRSELVGGREPEAAAIQGNTVGGATGLGVAVGGAGDGIASAFVAISTIHLAEVLVE